MIKGNESLVEQFKFLVSYVKTSKWLILMQTPLQLDIWLKSFNKFVNAKNSTKRKNLSDIFDIRLFPLGHVTCSKMVMFDRLFQSDSP